MTHPRARPRRAPRRDRRPRRVRTPVVELGHVGRVGVGRPYLEVLAHAGEVGLAVEPERLAQALGQDDAPVLVDLDVDGLGVEHPLERPSLLAEVGSRATFSSRPGAGHGVALEAVPARHPVDQHEGRVHAGSPVGVALLDDAAKRGGDRHAALLVHLVDASPLNRPFTGQSTPVRARRTKRRAVLPEGTARHLVRSGLCPTAPTRGLLVIGRVGSLVLGRLRCLYETCRVLASGLCPFSNTAAFRESWIPWEVMGFNGLVWDFACQFPFGRAGSAESRRLFSETRICGGCGSPAH